MKSDKNTTQQNLKSLKKDKAEKAIKGSPHTGLDNNVDSSEKELSDTYIQKIEKFSAERKHFQDTLQANEVDISQEPEVGLGSKKNKRKQRELSKLKQCQSDLHAIYAGIGTQYKETLTKLFNEAYKILDTPGERKVLWSQNQSEMRKLFGSIVCPIGISDPKIVYSADLYKNRPDKNITAYQWLEQKWGAALTYFTSDLECDYLYFDELRVLDADLAEGLRKQSLTLSSKGVAPTQMIPPKTERTHREVFETPDSVLAEIDRLRRLKLKYKYDINR